MQPLLSTLSDFILLPSYLLCTTCSMVLKQHVAIEGEDRGWEDLKFCIEATAYCGPYA
jgi:hypothetical protein